MFEVEHLFPPLQYGVQTHLQQVCSVNWHNGVESTRRQLALSGRAGGRIASAALTLAVALMSSHRLSECEQNHLRPANNNSVEPMNEHISERRGRGRRPAPSHYAPPLITATIGRYLAIYKRGSTCSPLVLRRVY